VRSRDGAADAVQDVTISPYNVRVEVRDGETLLRAIVRKGYKYRYGCRRGGCGFCKVHLVLGEVTYERPIDPRVLTDDERVSGICLSCRAVPLTNVVIELQEGDRLRGVPQSVNSAGPAAKKEGKEDLDG
jgi:ferredoxin